VSDGPRKVRYDAIVVGGGHNGLVAATYLARSGLTVALFERREILGGGGASTEEVFPGFRMDTGAHRIGHLHPAMVADLKLVRHGLEVVAADPAVFTPLPDGRHLLLWNDAAATMESIRCLSSRDAERWPEFSRLIGRLAGFLELVHASEPPSVPRPGRGDIGTLLRLGASARRLGRRDLPELLRVLPMSCAELMDEWFQADGLRGTLAAAGVGGGFHGPMAAGTAYGVLREAVGAPPGVVRRTLRPLGGLGALADALAGAAREAGVEIHAGSPVERVLVREGRAVGVVLEGGDEFEAEWVASSTGPGVTLERLVDPAVLDPEFLRKLAAVRYRGATAKVHYALGALPEFTALRGAGPHLRAAISISPGIEYLERAADAAKYGRMSKEPYLEAVIPSAADPSIAPPGKHGMSVQVQYAPYRLRDGEWTDAKREALGDRVTETLARYAPNLLEVIEARQVLAPPDLERRWALEEGSIHQGEMTLDQFFFARPMAGWARYRTPIEGLYLCGAGAHPGGGVTGLPGFNAARRMLKDLGRHGS